MSIHGTIMLKSENIRHMPCANTRTTKTETSYSEGTIRAADFTASIAKALECLWGSDSAKALGQLYSCTRCQMAAAGGTQAVDRRLLVN